MQEIDSSKKETVELQVRRTRYSAGLGFQNMNGVQAKLEEARQELQRLKAQRGVQGGRTMNEPIVCKFVSETCRRRYYAGIDWSEANGRG
jgi:hypothetical protein